MSKASPAIAGLLLFFAAGLCFAQGDAKRGEYLSKAGGCLGCHQLGEEGAGVGPSFNGIGGRSSAATIRQSILDPDAKVAAGFENFKGMMPKGLGDQMTATQLEALVQFLAGRK